MQVANIPFETVSEVDAAPGNELRQPQPQLFRLFECNRPLAASTRHCLGDLDQVFLGRGEPGWERDGVQLRLSTPDPWMSSVHARLLCCGGDWIIEDAGSRNGTLVNGFDRGPTPLVDGDVLEVGRTFFLFRSMGTLAAADPLDIESLQLPSTVSELATLSSALGSQMRELLQIASSSVSVLVQGETGTGKERIAQAVHLLSRRIGAFVAVNCGALPATLVESELFGCRRGAFTGAQDRPGLVRAAAHGTLFLDEVGDLPLSAQVALLRVLQERQVHPVGATQPVDVDFRLVCATQEPLEELVRRGRFRSDLFARIAGMMVQLPPLRQRREDLGIIIATLLRRLDPQRSGDIAFDKDAARALLLHSFPLNIRELEKCLERALVLAEGAVIRHHHLQLDPWPPGHAGEVSQASVKVAGTAPPLARKDLDLKQQLVALLGAHAGNLSATARAMGKAPVQIRRWLRRYQIDLAQFRR